MPVVCWEWLREPPGMIGMLTFLMHLLSSPPVQQLVVKVMVVLRVMRMVVVVM